MKDHAAGTAPLDGPAGAAVAHTPTDHTPTDHTVASAIALASLPDMGPSRLRAIQAAYGFDDGWRRVTEADLFDQPSVRRTLGPKANELVKGWMDAARRIEPDALLAVHRAAGVAVHLFGSTSYPAVLAADIDPPSVLFIRGSLAALEGPRVAIVGTRRCTQGGRLSARDMGHELAEAGVKVVSGLALGIDGAAHEGALKSALPLSVVGVAGTGLDRVYPLRHRSLWEAVAERGLLMSEVPFGSRSFRWRFPARNRMIAALADAVVVVESHAKGGSMHTVDEAIRRDRLVMAVPGSVRSPAAEGTNALIHDGVDPARDAADVLTALGFATPIARASSLPSPGPADPGSLDAVHAAVLDHVDTIPTSIDDLAARTGVDLATLALVVVGLEQRGLVVRSGAWLERV